MVGDVLRLELFLALVGELQGELLADAVLRALKDDAREGSLVDRKTSGKEVVWNSLASCSISHAKGAPWTREMRLDPWWGPRIRA